MLMKLNKTMLRSLLLVICGVLIAPCAWAQGIKPTEYAGLTGFKVTSPTGAPRDVWTTFEALEDVSLTLQITQNFNAQTGQPGESVTIGCYTYSKEDGKITVRDYAVFKDLQVGSEVSTAGKLDIKAGDMVGMWVQRGEGPDYSAAFLTEGSGYIPGWPAKVTTPPGVYKSTLFADGTEEGTASFVLGKSDAVKYDLIVSMQGVPASGAPLPGVVATVMLCGAVGGYFNRRKKGVLQE